jgi:hypothetical protein
MAQGYLKIDDPELDRGVCCESSLLEANILIASSPIKQTVSLCLARYCSTVVPPGGITIGTSLRYNGPDLIREAKKAVSFDKRGISTWLK